MKRLTSNEQATLILIFAYIFGAWFRLMPALFAGFPVNDGGMFYTMILDLQTNHYIAPMFTTYNHSLIPYAYPPLGFYIGAFLSDLFNVSPIAILRWLPGIVNAFTVPAFYFFAKEISKDKFQGAIETLAYALIPHLTSWHSMGGGLTRSLGLLFMLLTLTHVYRVFANEDKKSLVGAVIFGGLTALSHPESPIYAGAIALLIWAVKSRSLKGLLNGAAIAIGVFIVAGFWYGMAIYRHGLEPFNSISQTGAHTFSALFRILNVNNLTEEPYLDLFGTLGVLGFAILIVKKDYFPPLMLATIFLAEPRSAYLMGNIPLALAAGFFITEIILPALSKLQADNRKLTALFLIVSVYALRNSVEYGNARAQWILSKDERAAMQWVANNTPKDGEFLVISGDQNAFCDPINEWFPSLTGRKNLTVIQGSEWLLGGGFGSNMSQIHKLQGCINEGLECLNRESQALGKSYNYVYISIAPATKNCYPSSDSALTTRPLVIALESASEYSTAYRSDKVVVFKRK